MNYNRQVEWLNFWPHQQPGILTSWKKNQQNGGQLFQDNIDDILSRWIEIQCTSEPQVKGT